MITPQAIGVALYNDSNPLSTEGNFACRFRGEPFKFKSAADLDANTLWVTNASYTALTEAGLRLKPNIAFDSYFRTSVDQLIVELGLGLSSDRVQESNVEQQVAVLAEILGSSAEMFRLQLGIPDFPAESLMSSVGQMFGFQEAPSRSVISDISERAIQSYTACARERRHANNAVVFNFWVPRYRWAVKMLNSPVPINTNLVQLNAAQLPDNGADALTVVEWAEETNLPLFAKVNVRSLEQVIGSLMNYGAGAQHMRSEARGSQEYDSRNFREWCALPELKVLAQVGEVELQQIVVAGEWQRTRLGLHNSKVSSVSYSYGLVSENIWVGQTRNRNGKLSRSLSTSWLQSIDRMECLQIAEYLFKQGFEVITYGFGRIKVVCPISVRASVPGIAKKLGLLYPAWLDGVQHLSYEKSPESVMQTMINTRDYKSLIRANELVMQEMVEALRVRASNNANHR
ncbi:hypothetical protein KIP75_30365 [Pseudomonas aeruginosa]|uniref:hypothetical protein n=1 Tax=Pseudomonas aeruginosa TaxID=287 RepID=UPI001BFF3522|nr:hypothetical protein [Pseudomonas aeruginosa]MBT9112099.1 hypothetical protein [Pseudomonas aeruginosa]MBT9117841.1 hypothetical protein [Pseudomonas aeruginosa]MBT9123887.1 hypothetical protein [Pseudomonas aeruginosa]